MSAERELSVSRLVWAILREGKLISIMTGTFILLMLVAVGFDRPSSLRELAVRLLNPCFWLAQFSISFPLNPRTNKGTAAALGLTAPLPEAVPTLQPSDAGPGYPMFGGVGAAVSGFAMGLVLILWLTPRDPGHHNSTLDDALPFLMTILAPLMLLFVLSVLASSTRKLYAWSQDVASAEATARADADAARIAALQAQMNPHFLFNALNTVASLVRRNPVRAQETVRNLKGMLTHTFERSANPLTTFDEELQFVRDYLDIERERFGERLQVTYDLAPDLAAMPIPTMSLQPLVENAIKHAIATRIEGGRIRIGATMSPSRSELRLSVEDDGPGFAPDHTDGTGLGNLRARLQSLYGSAATLTTENLPAGARVVLTIPRHAHSDR